MTNIYIPTRDALHDLVDSEFFALHPDAPNSLESTDQADAEWRQIWLEIRDRVLERETDRVFHAMFPEAPHRLDPDDPGYSGYAAHWISIRDDIYSRTPASVTPVASEDGALSGAVDYSYLRADLYEDLGDAIIRDHSEVIAQVRAVIDDAMEAIRLEVDEGRTADSGEGETISLTREIEQSNGSYIRVTVTAWWSHELLHGRLEIDLAPYAK